MVRSRTKLLDRVLATTLAVIMLLAMIPMSTLTAFAVSYEAGSDCQNACGGKLEWVENPTPDAMHYLVCDNDACENNDISNAITSHAEGSGVADCLICNPPHVHGEFVYSLENENKTIVATCGSAGTCDLADGKVSITIVAPSDLEYDNTVKSATIDGATAWKAATGNDAPQITYNKEPKTVGSYTASITVDEKTASVGFEIVKGTPSYTVPTDLTAKYGQILADVQLPAGFAWNNEEASVGDIGVNTFKASFTPADTDNYNVVADIDVQITVGRAASVIAAPSIDQENKPTHTTITLEAITPTVGDGTIEYGYIKDEGDKNDPSKVTNWQTETTFDGLEGSTTYYFYARVSETTNYAAAISSMASISTKDKLNGEVSISIEGWTYGETANTPVHGIVTGDYGTNDFTIEYANKGQINWSTTVPTKAGEYTVRVSYAATVIYAEGVGSCDFEIKQREITVEWSNTTLTYNAQNQKPIAVITDGVVGTDVVAVVVSGAKKDAGDNYTAEATLSGETKDNYVIKVDKTQLFTIEAKEIVITWANTSLTHNKDKQKPTATINEGEIFAGDEVNVVVSGEKKRPGTHTATASLTGKDATNYFISSTLTSVQFVISTIDTPADPFTFVKASDGTTVANANANHWYNYDIKIIPKEGYTIGTADDGDTDFSSALTITESKQDYKVFLRDSKGGYTGEISIGNLFGNVDGNINIDKTLPTAEVKLDEGNVWEVFLETISFGIFRNTTQTVTITAKDEADSNAAGNSGIEKVFYYVSNVGMSLDTVKALEDGAWTAGTSVDFDTDNDYVVYTKIVDKAGNITYASSDGFVYDDTKPIIEVSYNNNDAANGKYFKADREVTIKITEHNFDPAGVKLTVKEGGINTSSNYALNWNSNGDVHTAKVLFTNEADYTFAISATDEADNDNDGVNYGDSVAAEEFTIDKTRPTASLVIEGLVKDASESWKETWKTEVDGLTANVLTSIDYNNRWTNANAKVSATSDDNLSGVDYIEYFRTENVVVDITDSNITWSNSTKALSEGRDEFKFEVEPNEKFIVYAHIVDKAGNDIYMSSNGVIVDDKAPGGDNYSPEVDITLPKANDNGIYNEDDTVKVDFKVVEPKYSGANTQVNTGIYSGIKEVKYVIKAEDINAVEEQTFDLTNGSVKDANGLISSWTGSITIDKEKFNSNNVIVMITAIDNAGNVHTSTTKIGDIKIDMTAPVIDIEYDNNAADSTSFFKDKRIAKVVITERNFKDNNDIIVTITNTDGTIPSISAFSKVEGTDGGNGDNTQWEATIVYEADGDYTFAIEYTDLADNVCEDINYAEDTVAATEFTVDRTLPTISVTYDNNTALNDKYFAKDRTATVVITEHNFDVTRVDFSAMVGTLEGTKLANQPEITWKHEGDVHTATIPFTVDGDYLFDVKMTDKAGNENAEVNYGISVAAKDFVLDKTIAKPVVGGVANGSAYKDKVIPTISFSDVNYDKYEVELLRTRKDEIGVNVTDEFIKAITENPQGGSGIYDTFDKIVENDGIYTLTVKMIDKAGNEETEKITFSVNRFGSVYEYDDYLAALIKDGGQYITIQKGEKAAITEDLVITEYNADRLLEGSLKILITRDGETIEPDYTTTPDTINNQVAIGESGWYQYVYAIKASNFAKDGVYKIALTSAYATSDSDKNESSSVPDNSISTDGEKIVDTMNFTVDTTAPEIRNIVNLEEAIVNAQTLKVKYTIVDVGGLKSIEVILNGETIDTITEFDGDVFNYTGTFTIEESSEKQTVQLRATDLAGNVTDTDSKDFSSNDLYVFNNTVTVSTNFFVRWYANTPLFWGSIAGAIVLAGGICFLIAYRNKKKEE